MTGSTSDERAIKSLVERPIAVAGTYVLDSFEEMMAAKANIGRASQRDGAWTTTTMTVLAADGLHTGGPFMLLTA